MTIDRGSISHVRLTSDHLKRFILNLTATYMASRVESPAILVENQGNMFEITLDIQFDIRIRYKLNTAGNRDHVGLRSWLKLILNIIMI